MKKEYLDQISAELGVQPIKINSALLGAQNRVRNYWVGKLVNGEHETLNISMPIDRGIVLKDILETSVVDRLSQGEMEYMLRSENPKKHVSRLGARAMSTGDKSRTLTASLSKGVPHGVVKISKRDEYRRLTPLECERLMNLPDDYTNVMSTSNTQRYKMIGNGFDASVIEWIIWHMI